MQSPGEPSRQTARINRAVAIDNPVSLAIAFTWTWMGMLRGHAASAAAISSAVAHFVDDFSATATSRNRSGQEDAQRHDCADGEPTGWGRQKGLHQRHG